MSSAAARASSDASNEIVSRGGAIALLVLFALVYLLPLGVRPLSSPDEVRYGEIAREMIASGDWVSPHFNGVRYFEKPILGHWLNSLSVAALGESRFAVRLPVALATGLSALIVFLLARRFLTRSTAVLASAIFLSVLIVAGCGSVAVLDAFLALFVTAAVGAYYVAVTAEARRERYAALALCGVACGAAFLTKGFIAWAIPAVVAAPYLIARRDWRTLLISPWLPFGVAILVSLPWGVLVHLREPDFWRYFVIVEHLQRFAGDNAQHPQPPWFFVAYLPAIGWPWIWLLPAAAIGIRGDGRHKDFLFYTALWAVMPLIFFSASKGKLLTYVLPCFAPLSILLAAGLERYFASGRTRAFRIAASLAAVLLALLLVLLAASQAGRLGAPAYRARRAREASYDGGAACRGAGVRGDRGPEHGRAHGTGRVHVHRRRVLPAARRRAAAARDRRVRAVDGGRALRRDSGGYCARLGCVASRRGRVGAQSPRCLCREPGRDELRAVISRGAPAQAHGVEARGSDRLEPRRPRRSRALRARHRERDRFAVAAEHAALAGRPRSRPTDSSLRIRSATASRRRHRLTGVQSREGAVA